VGNDSQNFCVVENLDPEKELFPIYVWAYCGEYIIQNGQLKTLSGSSGPVKIDYPNELSFYDSSRFSYEVPGDGSLYSEDIKRIFPENVQQKILNFDRDSIIRRTEAIATFNIFSWESIKQAISNCEAKSGFQNHSQDVTLKLKNGSELIAVEPNIDDIITAIDEATVKCGSIPIATE
jgi:ribosome-associated translation inhibitor RaiA